MSTSTARTTRLAQAMILVSLSAVIARAQPTYKERTLGAPVAQGAEPLRSIAAVRELSDGRVVVAERGPLNAVVRNMMTNFARAASRDGRGGAADSIINSIANQPGGPPPRIVVFDAKLASVQPVSRQAGADAPALAQTQALVGARADTTLLLVLGSTDLSVIDPSGSFVGSRSIPVGSGASLGDAGVAIDRSGRLFFQPRAQVSRNTAAGMEVGTPDSAAIIALDFKTGGTIPVAYVRVGGNTVIMAPDSSSPGKMKMLMKSEPFPAIDDWVLMPDGTLAIIRGADLHIDWIAPNGKSRATPPISYARQAVTDSEKVTFRNRLRLIDSLPIFPRNMSVVPVEPDSFPHFKPPFSVRGAMAASDGTIWIPSKIVSPATTEGYAVIGTDGRVREIVHLAQGQQLLGFGKGVVYVQVRNGPQDNRLARVPLH
jgi:hypothetical protein